MIVVYIKKPKGKKYIDDIDCNNINDKNKKSYDILYGNNSQEYYENIKNLRNYLKNDMIKKCEKIVRT